MQRQFRLKRGLIKKPKKFFEGTLEKHQGYPHLGLCSKVVDLREEQF